MLYRSTADVNSEFAAGEEEFVLRRYSVGILAKVGTRSGSEKLVSGFLGHGLCIW